MLVQSRKTSPATCCKDILLCNPIIEWHRDQILSVACVLPCGAVKWGVVMENMELWVPIALFCVGICALIWGGDRFVESASWIARQTGVPPFVIGATVVSFATTLPELVVSLLATMEGSVDMAVGNAVGSVSANIGLIMGISLLLLPGETEDQSFAQKGLLMMTATMFLCAFVLDGGIGLFESIVLLSFLFVFLYLNLNSMKMAHLPRAGRACIVRASGREILTNMMMFVLGLAGILLGAELLVDNGIRLARMLGASEAFIGLTFVAIGTSLPELITTLTAIAKKQSSLSVGNIIGANIIDITMILACCSLVSDGKLEVARRTPEFDLPVTLLLMAVAVVPTIRKRRFARWQGVLLLVIYAAYAVFLSFTI